jgi:hypothetical protein
MSLSSGELSKLVYARKASLLSVNVWYILATSFCAFIAEFPLAIARAYDSLSAF